MAHLGLTTQKRSFIASHYSIDSTYDGQQMTRHRNIYVFHLDVLNEHENDQFNKDLETLKELSRRLLLVPLGKNENFLKLGIGISPSYTSHLRQPCIIVLFSVEINMKIFYSKDKSLIF